MNHPIVIAVFAAWIPLIVLLFRVVGPRLASLIAIFGSLLLLPRVSGQPIMALGGFVINKMTLTGVGLLLGMLLNDPRTLLRARPRWIDLPVLVLIFLPLITLVTHGFVGHRQALELFWMNFFGYGLVYFCGRSYFGDGEGPRVVAIAIVATGLLMIPICLYETVVGPRYYLAKLAYGIDSYGSTVQRLGGWRPEGFLGNGLELCAWMALSTTTATWLWLAGWRPGKSPAWLVALSLFLTTIACRGVYGYILLTIGITSAVLTRWLRTRAILVVLAVLPLAYMGLRGMGLWDGRILAQMAGLTGREDTVSWRLTAEDEVIDRLLKANPILGFGTYIFDATDLPHYPDGRWLHTLWMGGLIGLAFYLISWDVLPVILSVRRPRTRPDDFQSASPSWCLASWCLLLTIDNLHNATYFSPMALIAGTLVSFGSGMARCEPRFPNDGRRIVRTRSAIPVPFIVTLVILSAIEILGHFRPGSPPPSQPRASDDGRQDHGP